MVDVVDLANPGDPALAVLRLLVAARRERDIGGRLPGGGHGRLDADERPGEGEGTVGASGALRPHVALTALRGRGCQRSVVGADVEEFRASALLRLSNRSLLAGDESRDL